MDGLLKPFAATVAVGCEVVAVTIIAVAALAAASQLIWRVRTLTQAEVKNAIWRRFARSIILALEFALAADVARTAFSPTWNELGQFVVIALVRTFLNYYLERDLEGARALVKAAKEGG